MPDYPSEAPTPELSQAFVTRIPDPETLVYEYVKAATEFNLPTGRASLSFYADAARALSEGRKIAVARGWPAFPGPTPAIGVGAGTETEDPAQFTIQGGFVGQLSAYDDADPPNLLGLADYYAEPLYVPVLVLLIHENRDERDRLHNQLRMVMTPLRTLLPSQDGQIKRVHVDASKDDIPIGAAPDQQPFLIYQSTFTVHVYCEMLTPREIVTPDQLIARIDVDASPADSGG